MAIEYGWFLEEGSSESLILDTPVTSIAEAGWAIEWNTYGLTASSRYNVLSKTTPLQSNIRMGSGYNYIRYTTSGADPQVSLFGQGAGTIQDIKVVMTDAGGTPTLEFYRDGNPQGTSTAGSLALNAFERLAGEDGCGRGSVKIYDTDGTTLLHHWQGNLVRNAADDGWVTRQEANADSSVAQPDFESRFYDIVGGNPATIADPSSVFVYNNVLTVTDTLTTGDSSVPFSVDGLGAFTDVYLSDGSKEYSVPFSSTGGSGTLDIPSLGSLTDFVYFTDLASTPVKQVTINVTDGFVVASKEVTLSPESPYEVATLANLDPEELSRVDRLWTNKLNEGNQLITDPTFLSPLTDGRVTVNTTQVNWNSVAYVNDSTGLTSFNISSGTSLSIPTANAGVDQTVNEGTVVTLDGSGSTGTIDTYTWSQTAGTSVTLSDVNAVQPTFTAPIVTGNETLTFELTTTNTEGSTTDTVDINITDVVIPPTANAGTNQSVNAGDVVTLDGSGSTGSDLSFLWEQLSGETVSLSGSTQEQPVFTAPTLPNANQLVFRLTASNSGGSSTDEVTIDVAGQVTPNDPPVADAGVDRNVQAGVTVRLDGSGSFDPNGDPITYEWSQTSGTSVVLSSTTEEQPTFVAPVGDNPVQLQFNLEVSDGTLTDSDQVTINVAANVPPPTPPEPQPQPNPIVEITIFLNTPSGVSR